MARPAATAQETSYIDPDRLYTLSGFIRTSGISQTRIHFARQAGVQLPRLKVGKRVFVRGADAIRYVEQLASLPT